MAPRHFLIGVLLGGIVASAAVLLLTPTAGPALRKKILKVAKGDPISRPKRRKRTKDNE